MHSDGNIIDADVPPYFTEVDRRQVLFELPSALVEMSRLSIEGEGKQNPTYTSYIAAFLRNTDLTLHYPYTA